MKYAWLAAPLAPVDGETVESNLARARRYYRELCLRFPDYVFLAPWILNCEVFEDTPENREAGMRRNEAVLELLDAWNGYELAEFFRIGPTLERIERSSGIARELRLWGRGRIKWEGIRTFVEGADGALVEISS